MNKERLKLLADHLRTLPEKLWQFRSYVSEVNVCGTVGCALGHCPDLWPDNWKIESYNPDNPDTVLVLKNAVIYETWSMGAISGASKWFDLPYYIADRLFTDPSFHDPGLKNLTTNMDRVTKEMVANTIDRLILENDD